MGVDLVVQGSSPDMPTGIPVWEALGSYAGQEITDDALGKWISDYHQCRKVGKLVQRPVALVRKLVLGECHRAYLHMHAPP